MNTEKRVIEIIKKIKNNDDLIINKSMKLTKHPLNFVAIDFVYLYLLISKELDIELDQNSLYIDNFSSVEEIVKTIDKKRVTKLRRS